MRQDSINLVASSVRSAIGALSEVCRVAAGPAAPVAARAHFWGALGCRKLNTLLDSVAAISGQYAARRGDPRAEAPA
jgi:hypothetical protein